MLFPLFLFSSPRQSCGARGSGPVWDGTGKHSFQHFFSDSVCSILSSLKLKMCTRHSVRYGEREKIVPPRLTSGRTNLVQSRGKDRVKVEKRTEIDRKNTTERYN